MRRVLLVISLLSTVGVSTIFAQGKCNDLFISEYMDGPNKNKVIEVYNPSDNPIDLSIYSIKVFNNGAPTPLDIPLAGTLQPKETYVVAHPQADANILNKADQTDVKMNFDGNDAIVLNKGQSTYIDKIGEIGVNPGAQSGWSLQPTGSTKSQDLRRKFVIEQGEIDWNNGKSQWETFPANAIQNIKDHDNTCNAAKAVVIYFETAASSVGEEQVAAGGNSHFVTVKISEAPQFDELVSVTAFGSGCNTAQTATNNDDYILWTININFDAGLTQSKTIEIEPVDDALAEGDEYICLELGNFNVDPSRQFHTVTIIDDEPFGIEDLSLAKISVDQNYAENFVAIRNLKLGANLSMKIYNSVGKEVINVGSSNGITEKIINIGSLSKGLYILTVIDTENNLSISKKIVRQ